MLAAAALLAACGGDSEEVSAATSTEAATTTTTLPASTTTAGLPAEAEADAILQHVTLVVSDFRASEEFYKDVLGFEEIPTSWLPPNQMFLSLGDNLELHVGEVAGVEINPNSFNHFAFSVEDLGAFLEHLDQQGVVYSSLGGAEAYEVVERPDGIRQTFFQDPDGYWVEVNDAR